MFYNLKPVNTARWSRMSTYWGDMSKHFFTSGHWQQTIPPRSNLMSQRVHWGCVQSVLLKRPPDRGWHERGTLECAPHCRGLSRLRERALEGLWASRVLAVSLSPRRDTEETATERHLDLSVRPTSLLFAVSSSSFCRSLCCTVTDHTLRWQMNPQASLFYLCYLAVLSSTGVHRAVTHLSSSSARPDCNTKAGWHRRGRPPTTALPCSLQTDLVVDTHFSLRSPTTSRPPQPLDTLSGRGGELLPSLLQPLSLQESSTLYLRLQAVTCKSQTCFSKQVKTRYF